MRSTDVDDEDVHHAFLCKRRITGGRTCDDAGPEAYDEEHSMPQLCAGQVVAFYLFDVAERIDLAAVPALVGSAGVPAKLLPKPGTPPYVQYEKPPLSFDGETLGVGDIAGFRPRVRLYDYGVASIALVRDYEGSWDEFTALGATLIENPALESEAEQFCRRVMKRADL